MNLGICRRSCVTAGSEFTDNRHRAGAYSLALWPATWIVSARTACAWVWQMAKIGVWGEAPSLPPRGALSTGLWAFRALRRFVAVPLRTVPLASLPRAS